MSASLLNAAVIIAQILLVLAMVAFTGGVSVARMLAPGAPERQRYRRGRQERR